MTTERKSNTQGTGKAAIIKMHLKDLRKERLKDLKNESPANMKQSAKIGNFFAGPHCTFLPQM